MVPENDKLSFNPLLFIQWTNSHGFLQVVAVLNGDETMYFEWGYCAEGYICIDR